MSWIALVGGIVTYLLGLWNAEMQLNEKGYYFAVLVLGLFSAASYQKTVRDKYEGIPTTSIYYMTCPDCLYYLCCITDGRSVECDIITQ
ncbi:hypothetical protein HTZ85_13610 [Escherichia coli]|nr:hypothetical protein [Escherichia coli]